MPWHEVAALEMMQEPKKGRWKARKGILGNETMEPYVGEVDNVGLNNLRGYIPWC